MTPYKDIVALTQQAQQAIADHDYASALATYAQSLKLFQPLNRPQLIPVLFNCWGKVLESQGDVQTAVMSYELALQALTPEASDDVNAIISWLSQVGKCFYLAPKLWLNIGIAYIRQSQENSALNAYQQALTYTQIETQP